VDALLEFVRSLFRVATLIVALVTAPVVPPTPVTVQTPRPTPTPTPKPITATVAIANHRVFPANVLRAREYARTRIGRRQFSCLDTLWQRESRWRTNATNRHSGAYGIPQALPPQKMSRVALDWRTNPLTQVKWGLMYISGRYGSACTALQHAYEQGWY
jgi:hypothetical protein